MERKAYMSRKDPNWAKLYLLSTNPLIVMGSKFRISVKEEIRGFFLSKTIEKKLNSTLIYLLNSKEKQVRGN